MRRLIPVVALLFLPMPYGEASIPRPSMTNETISYVAFRDHVIPALTIYRESRGGSLEAKRAVAWVIRNRVSDRRWPNAVHKVCLQTAQFSVWLKSDLNYGVIPPVDSKPWTDSCLAWDQPGIDPTGGANHMLGPTDYDSVAHRWGLTREQLDAAETLRVGKLRFYRL